MADRDGLCGVSGFYVFHGPGGFCGLLWTFIGFYGCCGLALRVYVLGEMPPLGGA